MHRETARELTRRIEKLQKLTARILTGRCIKIAIFKQNIHVQLRLLYHHNLASLIHFPISILKFYFPLPDPTAQQNKPEFSLPVYHQLPMEITWCLLHQQIKQKIFFNQM